MFCVLGQTESSTDRTQDEREHEPIIVLLAGVALGSDSENLKHSVTVFIMSRVHWCHQSLRHVPPTTAVTTRLSPPPPTASGCTGETSSRGHAHIFHLTVFFWRGGFARLTSFSPRFRLLLRGEMRECLFIKLFVSFHSFPSSCFSISVSLVTTLFLPPFLPSQSFLEFSF